MEIERCARRSPDRYGGGVKSRAAAAFAFISILIIVSLFLFTDKGLAAVNCGVKPDLSLNASSIHWSNYADYINRHLSIDYSVTNMTASDATGVEIVGSIGSRSVSNLTPMPIKIGPLAGGGNFSFRITYRIPEGITSFHNLVKANSEDGCGNIYAYPEPSPLVEPRIVATIHNTMILDGADGLHINGNYAYIASGGSNRLSIIDISNPKSPFVASSLSDPAGHRLESAWGVHVSGNYAFVVTGFSGASDSLTVVDVANPHAPIIVASIQDYDKLDGALHIEIAGNYAYITSPNQNRVTVVDISAPLNPRIVASLKDDVKLFRADGIHVAGNYVYAVSHQLDGGSEKSYLNAIDISDPLNPKFAGSLNSEHFRGGDQMAVIGNYLYIPGNRDHTFSIVDIANPAAMSVVSHITNSDYIGQSCFVDVSGKLAYLTSASANRLTVIDVADIETPQIVGSLRDNYFLYSALYVLVSGKYAYVTSPGGTFSVIELVEHAAI
ncbi:MAG: hypothetical protein ACYC6Z_10430 [Thermoleophilia bacterium]